MRKDKNIAIELRRNGKSYQKISKLTGISKSTLSNWFNGVPWSNQTKEKLSKTARKNAKERMTLISHQRRNNLKRIYLANQREAKNQFTKFIKERLFIAGMTIYWGEGDSKLENGIIRASNSDPAMIKLFYEFLKAYLPEIVHRSRMYLILYPDLNDMDCRQYWSKKVGIPLDRFIKSSYIKGKHPTNRLSYGIGTLAINSRAYKEKIITWLNLIKIENIKRV